MLQEAGELERELVGGAFGPGGQTPGVAELVEVEDAQDDLRVANVDGEQHGFSLRTGPLRRTLAGRHAARRAHGAAGRSTLSISRALGNRAATMARTGRSMVSTGSNVASSTTAA